MWSVSYVTELNDEVPAADFHLTPEDWEEVNAVHLLGTSLYAEQVRSAKTLVFLLFVILGVLMVMVGSPLGAILFGATSLIAPLLVGPLQEKAQRQSLKKMGEEGISNGTFGHHRIEVREEGLFHETSAYQILMRWHAIEDVKDRGDYLFVHTGTHSFIPIPTTAFPDTAAFRQFADAFMKKTLDARHGRPALSPEEAGPPSGSPAEPPSASSPVRRRTPAR
jgi:hypothetical protein